MMPFFNIYSPALHEILGVHDIRSVKAKIKNIGVQIYGHGKDAYIVSEEFITALKKKKPTRYISKNKDNNVFYE